MSATGSRLSWIAGPSARGTASPTTRTARSPGGLSRTRFHVLARALGALRDDRSWHWVLAGRGLSREHRRIADAGIAPRTTRRPHRRRHGLYGAADLFVHPTLYEGSSLVTLEAMARGVPVVATWAGGLPDKVRPHENGWLVAAGEADALARAVREALDAGPDVRQRFGQASRRIVEQEFAWPVVARQTLELYRELRAGVPQ
jgi:glycosyltransferase involved in cell wall biosynthesis